MGVNRPGDNGVFFECSIRCDDTNYFFSTEILQKAPLNMQQDVTVATLEELLLVTLSVNITGFTTNYIIQLIA